MRNVVSLCAHTARAARAEPTLSIANAIRAAAAAIRFGKPPPNQRLQRTGAPGSTVGWLDRKAEVVQVLCGRREVSRR